jgi:hypothetical protein
VSTAYYEIYLNQVLNLAQTLTIQSSATAAAINAGLVELGYAVDETNPASWKYYLNLQGEYHPFDTPMTVISLDTLQTIPFTVDNLLTNRATKREYVFGSSYYNDLVTRYPTQENLIRGILNPVVFETDEFSHLVIPDDGTILYYDPTYVEDAEENLIPQLQVWVTGFVQRWDNSAYAVTDELYVAAHLGVLFANIPMAILNIRLGNCKTRFVHSFHVYEYLSSNGNLGQYVDSMTTEQQLWLYRNIQYIKRNAGKQGTFRWLVYNILSVRGLPLAEWNMSQDVSGMPTNLLPDVVFSRVPLNFGFSLVGSDTKTVEQLLTLEDMAAKDNIAVQPEAELTVTALMQSSRRNELMTKVLESAVTDLSDATPYTFTDTLLNHWLYWAYGGRYNAVLSVTDAHTGIAFNIPVLDAFIAYLYAYNAANGITLQYVPDIAACHVQRIPDPTLAELQGIVESQYITTANINTMLDALPTIGVYISTEAFYGAALDVQAGIVAARALYTSVEDLTGRAQMELMTQRCYCDVFIPLAEVTTGTPISYANWFSLKGYSFGEYTAAEWGLLATELITEATGVDLLNARNLKDLQAAMLGLMTQLSSYSIQYIQTINPSKIKVIDYNIARIGTINTHGGDDIYCNELGLEPLNILAKSNDSFDMDLFSGEGLDVAMRLVPQELIVYGIDPGIDMDGNFKYIDRVKMALITFSTPADQVQSLPSVATNLTSPDYMAISFTQLSSGFTTNSIPEYLEMTAEDRQILKERFEAALSLPIGVAIHQFILDGLVYPGSTDAVNYT